MFNIAKHKTLLLQILKDIYTDITIASSLGFKGGTACFIFHGLPRFSTDLDFDILENGQSDVIFEKMGKILEKYGKIKDKHKKRNTLFFLLSYGDGSKNIKVEISLRNFGSKYEIKKYLGIPMLVMIEKDIFAHKLVALTERKQIAGRDLYDIWFFLKKEWEINHEIVEKRTEMSFSDYLGKCIDFIEERINKRNVLSGLGELLDENQKDFVKEKIKDEVIFLLKDRLTQ